MHAAFRDFILDARYPCVGAKAAINRDSYRFEGYAKLGSPEATKRLGADLSSFVAGLGSGDEFQTFVAAFALDRDCDERGFERALWDQLSALRALDAPLHAWDPMVSENPDDPRFAFSFAGTALFVVGMHQRSSRFSRQFGWPALVFNPRRQFEALRDAGRWDRFAATVRDRELAWQGTLNPNLAEHGTTSEARQYAGRAVEDDWRCPFR